MGKEWASMIKQEIIDIKIRLTAIESQLRETGISGGVTTGRTTTTATTDFTEISQFRFFRGEALAGITDLEAREIRDTTKSLVEATYAIRSATIAMRGYLMLIDKAGLSNDQKKMIRELEYSMMMIMKVAQAIRILQAVQAGTIGGPLGIFLAGGYLAAGIAYDVKIMGGSV